MQTSQNVLWYSTLSSLHSIVSIWRSWSCIHGVFSSPTTRISVRLIRCSNIWLAFNLINKMTLIRGRAPRPKRNRQLYRRLVGMRFCLSYVSSFSWVLPQLLLRLYNRPVHKRRWDFLTKARVPVYLWLCIRLYMGIGNTGSFCGRINIAEILSVWRSVVNCKKASADGTT